MTDPEPAPVRDPAFAPTWRNRRRVIFLTLLFCAGIVAYVTVWGDPASRLHETVAWAAFGLAGVVISGYVFGAVIDDANVMKGLK